MQLHNNTLYSVYAPYDEISPYPYYVQCVLSCVEHGAAETMARILLGFDTLQPADQAMWHTQYNIVEYT